MSPMKLNLICSPWEFKYTNWGKNILENLITTKQMTEKLGLQVSQTGKLARKRGVGRKLEGYLRVYLPEHIPKMEERKIGRPVEKGKRRQ